MKLRDFCSQLLNWQKNDGFANNLDTIGGYNVVQLKINKITKGLVPQERIYDKWDKTKGPHKSPIQDQF
jgi:hypothetical protein